jgi:hypothetical protein
MFTGDEAVMRNGPQGTEHMFIVDRIKELIKVKVCRSEGPHGYEKLTKYRDTKSHLLNSKLTSSNTNWSRTVL